uniref:Wsv440-like protein n=1 Tax=Melicertus latisulcatus majanivirus TaxID=2984277 RepID=A0A9C7BHS1_9VIRU|nr:MAG: wsv440-like protein [Melicertus latisulcatus majanivirus]
METNIENIKSWVTILSCNCKNSERLHRLLNSLSENSNSNELIKKYIFTNEMQIDHEISDIIGAVKLYNFMSTPINFLSRFGITDITACSCNEYKSNYKLSSCFILPGRKVLMCPNCILSCGTHFEDNELMAIIDYVSMKIKEKNDEHTLELFTLYKSLLKSNRPPLNGSWVTLIINDKTKAIKEYTIAKDKAEEDNDDDDDNNNLCSLSLLSGYVLVSNRIYPSRRGRDSCYCSDLLYIFTYIKTEKNIDRRKFGVKPICVHLLDEEFMLIKYELCSLNNILFHDEGSTLKRIIKQSNNTDHDFPLNHDTATNNTVVAAFTDTDTITTNTPTTITKTSNNSVNDDDNKIGNINIEGDEDVEMGKESIDDGNTNNIGLDSILLSIYNNVATGSRIENSNENIQNYNSNNEIAAKAAALYGDYRNVNAHSRNIKGIDNNNNNVNTRSNGKKNRNHDALILPPPVTQQMTLDELRKAKVTSSISTKDSDQNLLSLRVLKFKDIIYPYSCTLLPPPIIIRKSFNRYIFVSNIGEYFDSIQLCNNAITIPVKDSTLYEQIIMLINNIREISLSMCCNKLGDMKNKTQYTFNDNGKKHNDIDDTKDDDDDDEDDSSSSSSSISSNSSNSSINSNNDDREEEEEEIYVDNNYDTDDENDEKKKKKNVKYKNPKKNFVFNTRHVNTQLGIPLTHDEEILRYVNITSLSQLLQKQENYLF